MFCDFHAESDVKSSSKVPIRVEIHLLIAITWDVQVLGVNLSAIDAEGVQHTKIGGGLQPSSRAATDVQERARTWLRQKAL